MIKNSKLIPKDQTTEFVTIFLTQDLNNHKSIE